MAIFGGGGLSVRLSANTRSFEEGMSDSQRSLGTFGSVASSVLAPLQALGSQADDAEGEVDALGRSSLTTAGALGTLGGSASGAAGAMTSFGIGTEGAGFAVRGLGGSILLTLIPALTVLGATLVPIVAALGGFVAVAGAFAGIGIVGTLAAITTNTELLKTAFMDLANDLQTLFAPAIDLATEVLLVLILEFRQVMSELVPAEDTLSRIAGAFADLGTVLIDSLPAFVDLATTLTSEFLPPFNMWLRDILPDLPGMVMSLVDAMERMLPRFMEAGRLLMDMAPPLLEFGFAALDVVGPALADLASTMTTALERFNALSGGTQNLITQGVLLAPVLATVAGLLGGISLPVVALIGAIGLLWKAWETNFGNIRGVVDRTWQQIQGILGENLPTLIENVKTILDAVLPVIEPIFNTIIELVSTGLVTQFDFLTTLLTAVSEILTGDFAGAWETVAGFIERTRQRVGELLNRLSGGMFQFAVNQLIDFLNGLGTSLQQFLDFIGAGSVLNFEPIAAVDIGGDQGRPPGGMPGQAQLAGGGGGPAQVNIEVTGDTGVIEDVAADVTFEEFQARQARARRLANRGG